jgi:hypothetical protein
MASLHHFLDGKAPNTLRAAGLRQTTSLRNRVIARFAEKKRIRRRSRLGSEKTCSERLINTLLHQVISEISDISHGQHPASSG